MDYNRRHGHHGTIWESRFKSILVEPDRTTLLTVATYIKANPVKAGLVRRAGDYRWSGFGAALQGTALAKSVDFRITRPDTPVGFQIVEQTVRLPDAFSPGEGRHVAFTLCTSEGDVLAGRASNGHRVRHLLIPWTSVPCVPGKNTLP